jgi:hypothetical protein
MIHVTVDDYKKTLKEQVRDMSTKDAYWHFWGLKTWFPPGLEKDYIKAVNDLFAEYQDHMVDLEILGVQDDIE